MNKMNRSLNMDSFIWREFCPRNQLVAAGLTTLRLAYGLKYTETNCGLDRMDFFLSIDCMMHQSSHSLKVT